MQAQQDKTKAIEKLRLDREEMIASQHQMEKEFEEMCNTRLRKLENEQREFEKHMAEEQTKNDSAKEEFMSELLEATARDIRLHESEASMRVEAYKAEKQAEIDQIQTAHAEVLSKKDSERSELMEAMLAQAKVMRKRRCGVEIAWSGFCTMRENHARALLNMKRNFHVSQIADLNEQHTAAVADLDAKITQQSEEHRVAIETRDADIGKLEHQLDLDDKQHTKELGEQEQKLVSAKEEWLQDMADVKAECEKVTAKLQAESDKLVKENTAALEQLGQQREDAKENEEELSLLRSAKEVSGIINGQSGNDVVSELSQRLGKVQLECDRYKQLSVFKEETIETLQQARFNWRPHPGP